jgi:hypothetical protein
LGTKRCKLRLDIVQFPTTCLRQLYIAMKFRARPDITVIINTGEGGDKNREIYNATKARCVCGGCGDHRRCVRRAVMQRKVK